MHSRVPTSRIVWVNRTAPRSQPLHAGDTSVFAIIEELTVTLGSAAITDPQRVASDVVAALLEVPRAWPMLNRDETVDAAIVTAARSAGRMLGAGAPFAYAVGSACFRHLNLVVDQRVLIPRPETEVLVGEILERMEAMRPGPASWGTALDVGTGSGAIALSLASEGRFERVIATDASLDALDVARINASRSAAVLRAEVEFRHGSLLSPVRDVKVTALVSNPPYIAYSETESLPRSVRDWEPPVALLSARNGMAATAAIVRDGAEVLESGGIIGLEVDERRASLVAELMMGHPGYTGVGVALDLTGRERFVFASRV